MAVNETILGENLKEFMHLTLSRMVRKADEIANRCFYAAGVAGSLGRDCSRGQ